MPAGLEGPAEEEAREGDEGLEGGFPRREKEPKREERERGESLWIGEGREEGGLLSGLEGLVKGDRGGPDLRGEEPGVEPSISSRGLDAGSSIGGMDEGSYISCTTRPP